jgi:hypothetical protein
MAKHNATTPIIARLERALGIAARVVAIEPGALPIFERLDAELTAERAALDVRRMEDPVAKARAMLQMKKSV